MYRSTFAHLHTDYAPPAPPTSARVARDGRTERRRIRRPRLDLRPWGRRAAQSGC